MTHKPPRFALRKTAALLLVGSIVGAPASAFAPSESDPVPPRLDVGTLDFVFLGSGLALAGAGLVLDTRTKDVPATGLDPEDIGIGWDRRSISLPNAGAATTSDGLLIGTAIVPYVLNLTGSSSNRYQSQLRLAQVQGQSMVLAGGLALLLKPIVSRPRPYAYLTEGDRSADYDVSVDDAFQSFPSGHAVLAWSAGTAGMLFLASEHPELPTFWSGVLAGGLATSASLLRVDATRHFPTDVAAGAILGSGAGLGVTLLHLNAEDRSPRWPAVRNGFLGMAAGAVLAFLLTPPTSPWVE